jgi:hypothetical protein
MTPPNTVSVICLDCSWSPDTTRKYFRGKAKMHANRQGHRVQLETTTTVIYSDTPIRRAKGFATAAILALAFTGCTVLDAPADPTPPECRQYGFGHDGRDSSWVVPCDSVRAGGLTTGVK